LRILVDADATPQAVKKLLYKTGERLRLSIVFVANQWLRLPDSDFLKSIVVPSGADEADNHIVDIVNAGELVITADIPLADRVIKKGAIVIDPRGNVLDGTNIGERIATRDLLDKLRSEGLDTGGPPAYSEKNKAAFANSLNTFLNKKT
jgi:hypothetical protein